MSLEFFDGFDAYYNGADLALRWTNTQNVASFTTGRFGGTALSLGSTSSSPLGYPYITLIPLAQRFIGFAFKPSTTFGFWNAPIMSVADTVGNDFSTVQLFVNFNSEIGQLYVTRGDGTVLGSTASGLILNNTWVYIEFGYVISSTAGSVQVNVWPGGTVLSLTGLNTQHTTHNTADTLIFGGLLASAAGDDLYICNPGGTTNNSFLGECRIWTALPTGDSTVNTGWTPSTGTAHYPNVDTTNPSGSTVYNYTSTVGAIDTYTFPTLTQTGLIVGVQATATLCKDDAGNREAAIQYKSNTGIEHTGTTNELLSDYLTFTEIWETNPDTSATWNQTDLTGAEFGVNLIE